MLNTPAYASWFIGNLARSIALRPLSLSAAQELHALFNCAVERPKIGPVKRPCRLLWLMSRQLQNEPGHALFLYLGAAIVFALDWSLQLCARRLADVPVGGASDDVVLSEARAFHAAFCRLAHSMWMQANKSVRARFIGMLAFWQLPEKVLQRIKKDGELDPNFDQGVLLETQSAQQQVTESVQNLFKHHHSGAPPTLLRAPVFAEPDTRGISMPNMNLTMPNMNMPKLPDHFHISSPFSRGGQTPK
jgi:hypothetical protein